MLRRDRQILELLSEVLERLPTRSSDDLNEAFAGYTADTLQGSDLLGRHKLIVDIGRWLSARSLQTPLAIGLFGDWGSGKSFFMKRLQEEIDAIARRAAARELEQQVTPFCPHIVQVNFNAWLYSDSSIWPSLASQVFKAVAGVDLNSPGDEVLLMELRQYWARENPDYAAADEQRREAVKREKLAQQRIRILDNKIQKSRDSVVELVKEMGGDVGPEAEQAIQAGEALQDAIPAGKLAVEGIKGLENGRRSQLPSSRY